MVPKGMVQVSSDIRIASSLLAADFARLGEEVQAVDKAGADWIHLDVMDGHFVPNLTLGPVAVKALRGHTKKPFDVHLMVEYPEKIIPAFAEAGADILTIHPEAGSNLGETLQFIKSLGKKAGIALKPSTSEVVIDQILEHLDLVLVMTVNPGFGGQKFLSPMIDKIKAVRTKLDKFYQKTGRKIDLEVDGGINPDTAPLAIAAGANVLVAGTAIFQASKEKYATHIRRLREHP